MSLVLLFLFLLSLSSDDTEEFQVVCRAGAVVEGAGMFKNEGTRGDARVVQAVHADLNEHPCSSHTSGELMENIALLLGLRTVWPGECYCSLKILSKADIFSLWLNSPENVLQLSISANGAWHIIALYHNILCVCVFIITS